MRAAPSGWSSQTQQEEVIGQPLDVDAAAVPTPRSFRRSSEPVPAGEEEIDDTVTVTTAAEPESGGAPLTVSFIAEVESELPHLRYRWDFGDGSAPVRRSAAQHTYRGPGDYTATFSVIGADGVVATDEISIEVTEEGFDLDIEADPDIGYAPLAVAFLAVLDEELPGPFYFQWEFGDGGRDASNPTRHTYRVPGQYIAVVTVSNSQGQLAQRDVEIQVDPPEADEW